MSRKTDTPQTRDAARRRRAHRESAPTYKTEIPCSRGHRDRRYTKSSACAACAREGRKSFREAMKGPASRDMPDACECCRTPLAQLSQPHLFPDHDHETRKFRGWLCHRCNTGIGMLGDTLLSVERAAAYLALNS